MKKYNLIPLLLLGYLGVMCYLGWPHYASGEYSALRYFGIIALTIGIIILLRLNLKKRASQQNKESQSDSK